MNDDAGWGDLTERWDATTFESALSAVANHPSRQSLAAALVERLDLPIKVGRDAVKQFGEGLSAIAGHARGLGYDGVVLFLDELILWLAGRASDRQFLERETEKLLQLVESQAGTRPIPIISFVARQRTLRELVEARWPGADQVMIDETFSHHEGRFTEIELASTDLPTIARQRLLAPKDSVAEATLRSAMQSALSAAGDALREHQTAHSTRTDFEKVYPFSPVLVETLIHASSLLQRDRTALRAMLQLLVAQREHLEIGSIIPVGDLYDVIADGNHAVHHAVTARFSIARRLYEEQFAPILEAEHGIDRATVTTLPWSDAKRVAWRNDDRLLKTLLLSSLVPGVPQLQNLNSHRIAALNHGTIRTPLAGTEGNVVLGKLRRWAARAPVIRLLGSDANPTVSLELSAVDLEGILRNGAEYDTYASQLRQVRDIVRQELGLEETDLSHPISIELDRHGIRRRATLAFGNVGPMGVSAFRNDDPEWKVWIDAPIDEQSNVVAADRDSEVIRDARERGGIERVLVWRPKFLTERTRHDLGRLVRIDAILKTPERTRDALQGLSEEDRLAAKQLLEGNKKTLEEQLKRTIRAAYGLADDAAARSSLDDDIDTGSVFVSLDQSFTPRPPVAGTLRQGLEGLLEQAWDFEFPGAPRWPRRFARTDLERVLELCRRAASVSPPRVGLDNAQQALMRSFAPSIELGDVGAAFVLGDGWRRTFDAKAAECGGVPTVADLANAMDSPRRRGLPAEVRDLLIFVYADQSHRSIERNGDGGASAASTTKAQGSRDASVDWRGERRRNETHQSRVDPDARFARKGNGKEAHLCHSMHVLMENRSGLFEEIHAERRLGVDDVIVAEVVTTGEASGVFRDESLRRGPDDDRGWGVVVGCRRALHHSASFALRRDRSIASSLRAWRREREQGHLRGAASIPAPDRAGIRPPAELAVS